MSVGDLTAVLLCGGKGERLRPFTEVLPKPLVPLRGRPLLEHLMGWLLGEGVRRFVLCTGYRAEAIDAFVAERFADHAVTCVETGAETPMCERLRAARQHVPGRALVCYGDTLANVEVAALLREHEAHGRTATVTVYPLRSPFGVVELDERTGAVTRIVEKPILPHWINIGFMACEPRGLDQLPAGADLVTFMDALTARGELGAYRHRGRHLTVNTDKERSEAEGEVEFFSLPHGGEA